MDRFAIGVDIGGTRTKLGFVNIHSGEVMQIAVVPTERDNEAVFLQQIRAIAANFIQASLASGFQLTGIGLGVPAYIDQHGRVDSTYGFLPFMDNGYPLRSRIEEALKMPCRIDNDARVVALGEAHYGAGKGRDRVLVLTLGTGLGIGWVVGGRFPDGRPLGHMGGHISIRSSGERCYCGKQGCLEALVSSAAVPPQWTNMEQMFTEATRGNADAVSQVDDLLDALHTGIHNYVNLLAPDIIVLGGGIAQGLKGYEHRLKNDGYLLPHTTYQFELALSTLKENAGILGAAALFQLNIPEI
ncbi:MAG: ROK family protein [Chitinophagaceae bacterium]|nr:ROK family protein [Chitinophagaceae bacterium]